MFLRVESTAPGYVFYKATGMIDLANNFKPAIARGLNSMPVTLKDVARKAGVSVPTASLILNGRNMPFKESTRKAVLEAVESLSYRPDSIARRTGGSSTRRDAVGMLIRSESISHVNNTPVYEFICGVNDVLMEHQQFLVMVKIGQLQQEEQSGKQPRVIAERFVDGLIVESGLPMELEQAVMRYRIPTVWLNTNHHEATDCVYPDEIHAGKKATEHMIELGHRRILFIAPATTWRRPPDGHFSFFERQLGYEMAMGAHNLPTSVANVIDHGTAEIQHLVDQVSESHKGDAPITALVTNGLFEAVKLRFALAAVGIRCPEDISISTADDLHMVRRTWPEMTGIVCDRYNMGRNAAEMMLARVDTRKPQSSIVYQGKLIRGETTAAPKNVEAAGTSKAKRKPRAV